jgi:hypothetical protein
LKSEFTELAYSLLFHIEFVDRFTVISMPQSSSKSRKRKYQFNQWSQGKKTMCSDSDLTNTDKGSTSTCHASASARKSSNRLKPTAKANKKLVCVAGV